MGILRDITWSLKFSCWFWNLRKFDYFIWNVQSFYSLLKNFWLVIEWVSYKALYTHWETKETSTFPLWPDWKSKIVSDFWINLITNCSSPHEKVIHNTLIEYIASVSGRFYGVCAPNEVRYKFNGDENTMNEIIYYL